VTTATPTLSPSRARAKQRYLDWLRSESGLSFGDWLKNGGDPEPDHYCTSCAGTGMGRYEGGHCTSCHGTGDSSHVPRMRRCDDEEPASHEEYLERRGRRFFG
jgi:hypothetical protein